MNAKNKELMSYVGVKIIKAKPMDSDTFGRCLGENQEGYYIVHPDEYRSWLPKAIFEEVYRPISDKEVKLMDV